MLPSWQGNKYFHVKYSLYSLYTVIQCLILVEKLLPCACIIKYGLNSVSQTKYLMALFFQVIDLPRLTVSPSFSSQVPTWFLTSSFCSSLASLSSSWSWRWVKRSAVGALGSGTTSAPIWVALESQAWWWEPLLTVGSQRALVTWCEMRRDEVTRASGAERLRPLWGIYWCVWEGR